MGADSVELPPESNLGKSYVKLGGLVAITLYLLVSAVLMFYFLIKLWPPEPLPGVVTSSAGPPSASVAPGGAMPAAPVGVPPAGPPATSAKPASAAHQQPAIPEHATIEQTGSVTWPVYFFWRPKTPNVISLNASLFLIVILSGALGSLLHSFRSLSWYVGNRQLVWSWAVRYMLLPFSGAVLSTVFYIVIRAGFLPPGAQGPPNTPYGFAALGSLVGLFSEEAVLKLKQVAETVFAKAETGRDHAPGLRPPKIASVSPHVGPAATGITISGTDFAPRAKVNIGGSPATITTADGTKSITVAAPPHDPGPVDVEVINPDGQKGALPRGFQYT